MLEPDARKRARPVLRGAGRSNAPGLPGEGRALRTETTINDSRDFAIGKRLCNLPALRQVGFSANRRLLDVERLSHDPTIGADAFDAVITPAVVGTQRASALPFGTTRTQALLAALVLFRLLPDGFRNRDLRAHLAPLLGINPAHMTPGRMTYELRRLRLHGLIERIPESHRYRVTDHGMAIAVFLTRVHHRLIRTCLTELEDPDPNSSPPLRRALDQLNTAIDNATARSRLAA